MPLHPRRKPDGREVSIEAPSTPTELQTWSDSKRIATLVPDGELPELLLNGIALTSWRLHAGEKWANVSGQNPTIHEPEPARTRLTAGAIVVEPFPDGRVWVVSPTNKFANYTNTFPKGECEGEMSRQATAIKEVFEETGLKIEIDSFLEISARSRSTAYFYLAHRVGGTPREMDWESQAVHLVPLDLLDSMLDRDEDKKLIAPLRAAIIKNKYKAIWGDNPSGVLSDYAYQPALTKKLDELNSADFNIETFYEIVLWKLNRFPHISLDLLAALKGVANIEPNHHREAEDILRQLLLSQGIALPMASAILRFLNPTTFQIIDDRVYRIVFPGKKKYPTKPANNSESYLRNSVQTYFSYLDLLHNLASDVLPFEKADRILYQLDIKLGNRIGGDISDD